MGAVACSKNALSGPTCSYLLLLVHTSFDCLLLILLVITCSYCLAVFLFVLFVHTSWLLSCEVVGESLSRSSYSYVGAGVSFLVCRFLVFGNMCLK